MSTYRYSAQRASQVPVRQRCQGLRVASAAYYAWLRRQQVPTAEPTWQVAVRAAPTRLLGQRAPSPSGCG